MQSDDLSPTELNLIAFDVLEGKATRNDAQRLLAKFCNCADAGKPIHPRLIEHLRAAFQAYLSGDRSIEAALGLARPRKGRPKADEQRRIKLAGEVLRRRVSGMSHQRAVAEVSNRFNVAESVVGTAWKDHPSNALTWLRRANRSPWSPEEKRRLCRIFAGKKHSEWFTPR